MRLKRLILWVPMSGADRLSRRGFLAATAASGATLTAKPLSAKRGTPVAGRYHGKIDRGVPAFLGIRYARAQRFKQPIREPFSGKALDASRFGPVCPQVGVAPDESSEDCLFLNVWTPEVSERALRPVMVYFHGGAYTSGSVTDPITQGLVLAREGDVVVVTVNHRINVFGYGWLSPYDAAFEDSGNLGQLDLITALEWVRDHIVSFGGDPDRVMVFGQSGGGAKIATLMAMPAARGLFHSAATMSGQQVTASGPNNAHARTQSYFKALGLADGNVDALLALPTERLVEGLQGDDPILGGRLYFGPVLDMIHLHRHPFWPDAAPQSLKIPMILGNMTDETRAFIRPDGPVVRGLNWQNIAVRMAPQIRIDLKPQWVVDQYRARFPNWSPQQLFYAATTAGRSWPGQVIEADARARAGAERTWVYQFDRPSPLNQERGAAQTDDLPYIFGTLDAEGSFSGTDRRAQDISQTMIAAFSGLARNGRPGLADWSAYSVPERGTLMIAQDRIGMEDDPRRWQRELWATAPYIQPGS